MAKKKPADPTAPNPPALTAWELLALSRMEGEVHAAGHLVAQARLEKRIAALDAETSELRARLAGEAASRCVEQRVAALAETRKRAANLATEIADKYGVKWSTHSYNPETGELVALES